MGSSVVIATYRRVPSLSACLDGIRRQSSAPVEVIVVVHSQDSDSSEFVTRQAATWPELRAVTVYQDGLVAALSTGLSAAGEDIVAFVDDDAVPEPDWLERIVVTFDSDPRIAAVGGRDLMIGYEHLGPGRFDARGGELQVGKIEWWGRMIANHHLGTGRARDVDILKGVNMSFRRADVIGHGFDDRLRGPGAQVHSELSICLPLRRRGLRIVYDPAILVMHYSAPRPPGNERLRRAVDDVYFHAHNEALAIYDYLGSTRGAMFAVWGLLAGSTDAPGIAVGVRSLLNGERQPWAQVLAAQRGRFDAWKTRRRVPRARLSRA
jgi:GT2 family glycosyltransferase